MTRKDYVLIAVALNTARNAGNYSYAQEFILCGVNAAAKRVADAPATDNPRFDREQFLEAACAI